MKKLLLLLCSAFFILSCNDDSQTPPKEEKLIPTRIVNEWVSDRWYQKDSILFEYDNLNRPIRVTTYTASMWNGSPDQSLKLVGIKTFEYNNKDLVVHSIFYRTDPSKDLILESLQELKLETSYSGTIYGKDRYSFSEDYKDQSSIKFTINDEGQFVNYDNDKYWYDDKGNIIRGLFSNKVEKVYKYDNKNGIFKDVHMPFYMKGFLCDILIESLSPQVVVEGITTDDSYVDKYVNEYNGSNYPKKIIHSRYTTGDSQQSVHVYDIEYKKI